MTTSVSNYRNIISFLKRNSEDLRLLEEYMPNEPLTLQANDELYTKWKVALNKARQATPEHTTKKEVFKEKREEKRINNCNAKLAQKINFYLEDNAEYIATNRAKLPEADLTEEDTEDTLIIWKNAIKALKSIRPLSDNIAGKLLVAILAIKKIDTFKLSVSKQRHHYPEEDLTRNSSAETFTAYRDIAKHHRAYTTLLKHITSETKTRWLSVKHPKMLSPTTQPE